MNSVHDQIERVRQALPLFDGIKPGDSPSEESAQPFDCLASAIADIAAHYGRPADPRLIVAGLPVVGGRLPLDHAGAAAERAGLKLAHAEAPLHKLRQEHMPVVVVTSAARTLVVWQVDSNDALISTPGSAERRSVPLADLVRETGRCISLIPASDNAGGSRPDGHGWLLAAFRDCAHTYGLAIVATLAINLLALALPLYTMNVYDRVVPNGAVDTLVALSLGVVLATGFDLLIKCLRSALVDAASRRADVRLANWVFSRLLGAKMSEKPQSAGSRANTLRELETLREMFNSATLTTLGDLPFVVVYFVTIAIVAGPLVVVVLAFVPVIIGVGLVTERRLTRRTEQAFRQIAQKQTVAVETLVGLETLKAAGAESFAAAKWERAVADATRTGLEIRELSNHGVYGIGALSGLLQVATVVTGFFMVSAGGLTSGALIATMMLVGRAIAPLSQTAILLTRLQQARQAHRALDEIAIAPQERPAGATFLSRSSLDGRLELEGVTFAYQPNAAPALRDLSFKIQPGERVGIIGGLGSGKSTLLRLIVGLSEPQQGRVLIDGAAVGQLDPAMLRREVGLSLQGGELFQGTVRSNITLAEPQASDAAILRAARLSGALDWIERMPTGFDTEVRERGGGLSRGQKQSVALARALLRDPKVILLDEPTSDMDLWTEQQIVARLREATLGRTLVVVTHRPAPLELVDRLIVLDQGVKIADGPKDEVMRALRDAAARRAAPAAPTAPAAQKQAITIPLATAIKAGAR